MNLPIETLEHLTTQLGEAYEALREQYQQRLREGLDAIETTVADWKWKYEGFEVRGIPATPVAEKWIAEREKLNQGPFKLPFVDEKLLWLSACKGEGGLSVRMENRLSPEAAKAFHKLILEISLADAWDDKEASMATAKNSADDVEREAVSLTERANFFRRVEAAIFHGPVPEFHSNCPFPIIQFGVPGAVTPSKEAPDWHTAIWTDLYKNPTESLPHPLDFGLKNADLGTLVAVMKHFKGGVGQRWLGNFEFTKEDVIKKLHEESINFFGEALIAVYRRNIDGSGSLLWDARVEGLVFKRQKNNTAQNLKVSDWRDERPLCPVPHLGGVGLQPSCPAPFKKEFRCGSNVCDQKFELELIYDDKTDTDIFVRSGLPVFTCKCSKCGEKTDHVIPRMRNESGSAADGFKKSERSNRA